MSENETNTLLSRDDVQQAVHNALGSGAQLVDYSLKSMSGDKVGFAGAHQFLHIEATRNGEKSTLRLFVKTLPYDIPVQVAMIENCKLFVKESKFYESVLPKLMESIKDKHWSALCYLAKEYVLILDNLKDKNFELKGMSLSGLHMKSAIKTLALMHASAMIAEKKLGKSFLELYPEVFQEAVWTRTTKFYDWYTYGVEAAVAVAKRHGLDHARIGRVCGAVFEKAAPSRDGKWRNVVCHGDTWAYNCLFDEAAPLPRCALVDFQMVRYAPATSDVATLLYLATRKDERRKIEKDTLRHYHKELCSALRENEPTIEPPSLEYIVAEYEDMRLIGMVHAMVDRPITQILEIENSDDMDSGDAGMGIVFGKRDELVMKLMDEHPDYKDMVLELIGEIIEYA
ncbi:uncharacterized protein LOC106656894 [Trichogramma pretiosum]|uniref:uncharacterized protein LOC106656894 n=1 Tax=Trichogramma pretiosum TaxID=7493 RepID=UPI0006C96670|nr:uncharacterized protein LOC106656894 [Trichogramma pretiosum]